MNVQYDSKEKIWSTPKQKSIYSKDVSVGKIIFNTMKNWPKNVCQVRKMSRNSHGVFVFYWNFFHRFPTLMALW